MKDANKMGQRWIHRFFSTHRNVEAQEDPAQIDSVVIKSYKPRRQLCVEREMLKELQHLNRSFRVVLALSCTSTLLFAQAVIGQQEQDSSERESSQSPEMEEIIVTATKRATDLMTTPVAVSAVSQERLTDQNVSDVTDLGDLVPNMQVGTSPSDSGVQVTVRGITSNNFTELGDPTVSIHVDGMYSPRPQAGLALLHDVERVEILRGPQGTLFGRNSTSGSINIVTSNPSSGSTDGSLEFDVASFSKIAGRGWFNLPLGDSAALRVSTMFEQADSYLDQSSDEFDLELDVDGDGVPEIPADGIPNTDQRRNKPVDDSDAYFAVNRWAVRAALRFEFVDYADVKLTYDLYSDASPGGISLKDCEKAEGTFFECDHDLWHARINVPGELDFTINTFRLEAVSEYFEDYSIEYRVAASTQDRFQQYDGDGGAFADPEHPGYGILRFCCGAPPLVRDAAAFERLGFPIQVKFPFEDLQLTTRDSTYSSVVHELQIKSNWSRPLNWIAGVFVMAEENSIRFDVELPWCCGGGIPLAQSFVQPDRGVETQAIFAQFDYSLEPDVNLTLGYRQTWDEKYDRMGSNHSTIGYWVNPGLYDPAASFWYESWGLIGVVPGWHADPAWYQSDKLNSDMGSLAEDFPDRIPGTDNTYTADWNQGTWRLGADYLVNSELFVYGSVASGFKAGGFGDKVDVCECGEVTAFAYDPEEVITYEAGMKAEVLDRKMRLLGSVFLSDYSNMQRTSWVIVGRSQHTDREIGTLLTTNLAEANIFGIELEFDWLEPWRGGHVFGWASYLNAEIGKLEDGADGLFCFERAYMGLEACPAEDFSQPLEGGGFRRPTDLSGNKLPWSPEWSFSVTAEHSVWTSNGYQYGPSLTLNWQSEMFFNDTNYDDGAFHAGQEGFLTVNVNFKIINERQAWALVAFGYNMTDQVIRSWADPGPGYWRANFFPPRSMGLRFSKSFD